jgi:hypothetical protein
MRHGGRLLPCPKGSAGASASRGEEFMAMWETESAGGTIALECAAFLGGTLAEYWDDRGIVVPVWAWTNLLAHGSEASITASMVRSRRSRRAAHSWRVARSYVAYELFDLLDDEFTLADMQATVLVPVELEMAARPDVSRWSPRQWVEALDHAIRHESPTLGYEQSR